MSTPLTQHRSDMMLASLDRLRGTGAEFAGFLSNHGPMAADAMIRLGGGDRVERWVENYRTQLAPAPQPGELRDIRELAPQPRPDRPPR